MEGIVVRLRMVGTIMSGGCSAATSAKSVCQAEGQSSEGAEKK